MVHLTFSRSIVELARLASGCESEQLLENSGITQIYWWNYTHMETVSGKSFLNVSIDPKYLVTSLFILPNLGLENVKYLCCCIYTICITVPVDNMTISVAKMLDLSRSNKRLSRTTVFTNFGPDQ